MRILAFALLFAGLPSTALAADVTVTYQLKEGKKTKGEKTVYWSDQYQLTTDSYSKMDVLSDYIKGVQYTIDHKQKQIQVMNMKEMAAMSGGASQMMAEMMQRPGLKKDKTMGESLAESANKFMGDPNKAVLQKLGTLTIAGRSCDHYKVERKGGRIEMTEEVCVDPTLNPPRASNPDMEQMMENAQGMMSSLENLRSPGQRDLAGIKGIRLMTANKTKAKMMFGGGARGLDEEATLVKEGPIDPSVFRVPDNYPQIDQGKMMKEEMEKAQKMMGGG